MCGIKQINSEPRMMNCDCKVTRIILTKQEKIEKLEQYQKCLEHALSEVKQKLQSLTENNKTTNNCE